MSQKTFCSQVIRNVTDLHPRDDKGSTPLGGAADINPKDIEGMTPLHFAAAQGYIEICHLIIFSLIVNNTNVNPSDNKGNTPLHVAAANGEKEV